MEYKRLGSTDLEISRIGFGCWAIGGHGYGKVDDSESIRAIHNALDLGINVFDTADVYGFGHSEEILGKALGSKKSEVVIATKFGVNWDNSGKTFYDCSPKRATEALEGSLRRLKTDCVTLYQIHWYDNVTPISETVEVLRKCQQAGKIRYIGCSNFPLSLLLETVEVYRIESLQCSYNISQRNLGTEMIKCCETFNISIIAYNVLARGLFSGKYDLNTQFAHGDTRGEEDDFRGEKLIQHLQIVNKIKKVGLFYKKSPSQVAIRWVLDNPSITSALVGIKVSQQILENSGALGWKLREEDLEYIKSKNCKNGD